MSATEQREDEPALDQPQREPPPVVFAAAAAKAAKPVVPHVSTDRRPLSQAATRPRAFSRWFRRLLALVVLAVAIAGILTAVKDSKITIQTKHHHAARSSTLLSAEQLGLTRHHGRGHSGRSGAHHRQAHK